MPEYKIIYSIHLSILDFSLAHNGTSTSRILFLYLKLKENRYV